MSYQRHGGEGFRAASAAWLFAITAPLLVYLVIRAALMDDSSSAAVPAALLPPADYRPLARQIARATPLPSAKVTPDHLDVARKAAISSPLSYEPFLLMGKAAEQDNDLTSATRLLQEVRRRRPSNVMTRVLLASYYARKRQSMPALLELDATLRLNGQVRTILLPELTKLLNTSDGLDALTTVLAAEPIWREDFLKAASEQKLPPARAVALLRLVSAKKKGRDIGPERRFAIHSLVFNGAFNTARDIWLQWLSPDERRRSSLLFDGDFNGVRSTGPFGWKLHELDVGGSEVLKDGGESHLDVRYHGGRTVTLAEQVIALKPGRYILRVSAKTDDASSLAGFTWQITCLPESGALTKVALTPLSNRFSQFSDGFEVPAGKCVGQKVTLEAEPGEVAAAASLQVARVEVARQ